MDGAVHFFMAFGAPIKYAAGPRYLHIMQISQIFANIGKGGLFYTIYVQEKMQKKSKKEPIKFFYHF